MVDSMQPRRWKARNHIDCFDEYKIVECSKVVINAIENANLTQYQARRLLKLVEIKLGEERVKGVAKNKNQE